MKNADRQFIGPNLLFWRNTYALSGGKRNIIYQREVDQYKLTAIESL